LRLIVVDNRFECLKKVRHAMPDTVLCKNNIAGNMNAAMNHLPLIRQHAVDVTEGRRTDNAFALLPRISQRILIIEKPLVRSIPEEVERGPMAVGPSLPGARHRGIGIEPASGKDGQEIEDINLSDRLLERMQHRVHMFIAARPQILDIREDTAGRFDQDPTHLKASEWAIQYPDLARIMPGLIPR